MKTWTETIQETREIGIKNYKMRLIGMMHELGASQNDIDQINDETVLNAIKSNIVPEYAAFILIQ